MNELNPAQERELHRLIVEQEADDTPYVSQWDASLDASLKDSFHGHRHSHAWTLHDAVDDEQHIESGGYQKQANRVTAEQVREWRSLRNTEGWTYAQIAEHAGVQVKTVRQHISCRSRLKRAGVPSAALEAQLEEFQAAYEAGASMRQLAELHYEDLGYKTWESCRQQLRVALKRNGVALRQRTPKHGMRAADAPQGVRRRYQRERQRKRSRVGLTRCDAVVKSGRPCRRWALRGTRYCVAHTDETRPARKWSEANVLEALRVWAGAHGRPPSAADWSRAEDGHPSFRTVTDLFGKWNFALYEAGLRERKHAKPRKLGRRALLNRGYKECAAAGCTKLVAPSRNFCRDRECQSRRFTDRMELAA